MMSEIKISEMVEAEEVNSDDLIMIIQNGVNKKTKAINIGTGGGGDSIEIIQEDGEASETNVYSAKAIDEITAKNIAVAYDDNAGQQDLNAEYNKITFTNADIVGDKLKFENGKIVVGKDVKKLKVSATAFLEDVGSTKISYIWLQILQNGQKKCGSIASGVPVWFQSIIISDYILDVKENDYIELEVNNANYTTHIPQVRSGKENTRLYVEVIE